MVPLSDDKAYLRRTVEGYRDGGTTAGHLGTAWGWYLVSPEWAGGFAFWVALALFGALAWYFWRLSRRES